MSISLAVSGPFNPLRCPIFDPQRFWCSAFLVADGAAWLSSCARSVTDLDPKTVHTAGLLHNLGLLWLAENMPQEAAHALEAATADDTVSVNGIFRQMVHTDIREVGGCLGRAWRLPDVLVVAMEHHGNPGYDGAEWQTAALVRSAVGMVAALHRGVDCPPDGGDLGSLDITWTDQQEVFAKLAGKLEDTAKLAQSLCSARM